MATTENLFKMFSEFLTKALENGGVPHHKTDEGELILAPIDGATLGVIRAFLKDFPPDMEIGEATSVQAALSRYAKLPFQDGKAKDVKSAAARF
jgi:hypothetical protein